MPSAEVTLFDFGRGTRRASIPTSAADVTICQVGSFYSRRYYRFDNLAQMMFVARLGLGRMHPAVRRLTGLDVILDLSGGDSFSDIYGRRRFDGVVLPKLLALRLGIPLILLPQTYGPYGDARALAIATRVSRGATQLWARDPNSFDVAKGLLAETFDPARHLSGVDVAFGLTARRPADAAAADAIERARESAPVLVGLNVSGLLYNEPGHDVERYGLLDGYRETIHGLLAKLLAMPGVTVLLVPHVVNPSGRGGDCDAHAAGLLLGSLAPCDRERVVALPPGLGAMELKWAIGQCDWFCGTRMHACIAAISQGVPATAIAYSDKTSGVFRTAGIEDAVVDPRRVRRDALIEQVVAGFSERRRTAVALAAALPQVRQSWDWQFAKIAEAFA